jgi:hypothetical protein
MSLVDAFFSDFWDAVQGNSSEPIPNFSTQPTWLYSPEDYSYPENWTEPNYSYDRGAAPARSLSDLGAYYGRLWSYFKLGGFTDEAGTYIGRPGGPLNVTLIEVFNEVDYEHGHTPESYTQDFDAVVAGVRQWADPEKSISFVGLSLPNIDSTEKVVQWASYFLNASNHAAGVADAKSLAWIGYHAYPTNGGYSPDPNSFERLFDYADELLLKVQAVDAVIQALSPLTRTALDETGTDMDNVLGPGPPPGNSPRYWVASAAYFAYIFARLPLVSSTVAVLGASQLMDAPGQEPSVTLLDWETGQGTARFWVVALLANSTSPGDTAVPTEVAMGVGGAGAGGSNSSLPLYAQGFAAQGQPCGRLLLINKQNAGTNVSIAEAAGCSCQRALVLDESSGLQPAREQPCPGSSISLAPFATAMLFFA